GRYANPPNGFRSALIPRSMTSSPRARLPTGPTDGSALTFKTRTANCTDWVGRTRSKHATPREDWPAGSTVWLSADRSAENPCSIVSAMHQRWRSWHLSTCSATNGLSTCNGRRRTWRRWGSPRCRGVNTWRGYRRCAPARYRPSGPARLRTGTIATLVVFELHAELQPHVTVAQIHQTQADGAHRCGNPMELRVDVIARNLLDLSQINEYAVQQLIGRSHDRLKCLSI